MFPCLTSTLLKSILSFDFPNENFDFILLAFRIGLQSFVLLNRYSADLIVKKDLIIKKIRDNRNYSEAFKLGTKQALEDFKGKKIKIGRARMFEEKTKDLDDPGMLALNKLSEAF